MISPSQRPLPTQHTHTKQTNIHAFSRFTTPVPCNQAIADMRLILHGSRIRQICRHRCETINSWLQSLWGFEASWMWHCTVQKIDTNFCKNFVSVCSGQHNKPKPFLLFYFIAFFLPLFSYPLFSLSSSQSPLLSSPPVISLTCNPDHPVKC